MARKKEVRELLQSIEMTKCFEMAMLDMSRRMGVENSSKAAFDPIIWEICKSLDYEAAVTVLSLFAGKTVRFPSHSQIKTAVYRASALHDKDRGMSDENLSEKYHHLGGRVLSDLEKLEKLRKLGDRWAEVVDSLERTFSGKDTG